MDESYKHPSSYEEYSSIENARGDKKSRFRTYKSSEPTIIIKDGWCHQCKMKQNEILACVNFWKNKKENKCNGKYCGRCIEKHYNHDLQELKKNPGWVCYSCQGICACAACKRKRGTPVSKRKPPCTKGQKKRCKTEEDESSPLNSSNSEEGSFNYDYHELNKSDQHHYYDQSLQNNQVDHYNNRLKNNNFSENHFVENNDYVGGNFGRYSNIPIYTPLTTTKMDNQLLPNELSNDYSNISHHKTKISFLINAVDESYENEISSLSNNNNNPCNNNNNDPSLQKILSTKI
eukprot:TRINITY_DN15052_c0_g1_i1.p1 TRINITY_DN15052_c0_g1~~TRINITY_DN15052_c0_g1_i1.p1  ORF type:complete len:313 (-),score=75.36 TRINITY_DN15052_c0_g1_i1:157-1026(-)